MALTQAGCYLQSLSNGPASMLAAHWLPALVSLAGFLPTFSCPVTASSTHSQINIPAESVSLTTGCHSPLRPVEGGQQEQFLPGRLRLGKGRPAGKKGVRLTPCPDICHSYRG